MLKQKDIMECLPLLASVLGNQYGVTVEIGGSEAYTDGKTIHLPALPLDSEPELITMIKGYGLGIMCSNIATLLSYASRVIETFPQLAPALFGLLEGALRRNA